MPDATRTPYMEALVPVPDPVACCERLEGIPHRVFLDSAQRDDKLGRYSFLSGDPAAVISSKGLETTCLDVASGIERRVDGDILHAVATFLQPHTADPIAGLPPFQGGAAGYLSYDWARLLESVPPSRYDDLAMPDAVMGIYDWVIAWDHRSDAAWLISTGLPESAPDARRRRAVTRAASVRARLLGEGAPGLRREQPAPRTASAETRPASGARTSAPSFPVDHPGWACIPNLRSSFSREGYLQAAARVRQYVRDGDIFQANLSQRFEATIAEPTWSLYRRLRAANAAPFAAYLDFPDGIVLSASPERFVRVDSARQVETRPIKGTRPRGHDRESDAALAKALQASEKDRAENLMIVDLMRNDVSRVCLPGTVRVPELCVLEHYPSVHHLVSTVTATLAPDRGAIDLLRAAFPAGSITGAPKVRAMEVIAELEPSQRGVYSGAIGYLSVTGTMDMNVAIRTIVAPAGHDGRMDDDTAGDRRDNTAGDRIGDQPARWSGHRRVFFNAGGAIVADSDPAREYEETLHKARGLIASLATP